MKINFFSFPPITRHPNEDNPPKLKKIHRRIKIPCEGIIPITFSGLGDDTPLYGKIISEARLRDSGTQNLEKKKGGLFILYRTALTYARGVNAGNHR